jgi:acyl-CoA reductase-like NAD-dependent aldehyde dehydrogenase
VQLTIEATREAARQFAEPRTYGHFIAGKWTDGDSGELIELKNPTNQETLAYIQSGNAVDVKRAVDAAHAAFPKWSRMYPGERQTIIAAIIEQLRKRRLDYAVLETLNNGKSIYEAYNFDITTAIGFLEPFVGAPFELKGETYDLPDAMVLSHREPIGVVAQIIPWNVPLIMFALKVGPALAAGCTIVLKPSEIVCMAVMEFVKDIAELLPPGVLNVVTGYGAAVGEPLITDPRVRKVAFTGSRVTAQKIITMAAQNIIPQTMELGGKSAHIICEDADLEAAAESAVIANIVNKGEACIAGTRLFVHRKIADDFLALFQAKLAAVPQGDPLDPAIILGPQASKMQYDKILKYIELGQQEGARVMMGGHPSNIPGLEKGLFIQPTLLGDVRNDMRVMQEEIFGPVTGVFTWDDEADMMRQANDTSYGLAGGIWTKDLSRAHKMARSLETGMIWINRYLNFKPNQWVGGHKASGYGTEGVRATMDHYTVMKSIVINL